MTLFCFLFRHNWIRVPGRSFLRPAISLLRSLRHRETVIHYHGTPITPRSVLAELAGRCFCVRYGEHNDAEWCHTHGQSVMLDNGAFSFWRQGLETDWPGYYKWVEPWLEYQTTWAVIPDVIGGSEEENDLLLAKWFQQRLPRGAPVWHMHESIDRLKRLANGYERICIGSSEQYADLRTPQWHRRMDEAFNAVCGNGPPPVWIHMLRGMALSEDVYPFASVDSTDIARNHHVPQNTARKMADRWDAVQPPPRWRKREQLALVE